MMGVQGMTLGVIFGNRDFFPDGLVAEARKDLLEVLAGMGVAVVALTPEQTKLGAVETWQHAVLCGNLLREAKQRIDGVLICLPNFGDEKGIADALRLSELTCPILVQACPDDLDHFGLERRRDSFCGKISACNNLRQYGLKFTLTRDHTVAIKSDRFREDLVEFLAVCRVVKGLRRVRIGAVGARPNAFNTTRYSEKLLEAAGISVNTIDLSEVFGQAAEIGSADRRVVERIDSIKAYADSSAAPDESMLRMAKFAVVIDGWMEELGLTATAIQCWSSMQKNYGVNVCTIMSMMSEQMLPSACEVDIAGVVSMYALQLASGRPSALVDWNNNYGNDPDKCVFFHCGNWAKDFLPDIRIGTAPILGTVLGEANTVGALAGRTPAGPVTFGRVSTDDTSGIIRAYVGEGQFTDDPLDTFGTKAVVAVPRLPELMRYICRNGFEHHAAMTGAHCAGAVTEGLGNYLGWEILNHG
ncbi:L-fucose/L-arabinose isomerase family protein [Granulicella sp. WH15]|uniref:L-fucose/L-arabinose isomerase family protein n=1 Tax=Granulicella sp. WH15 TaxID=2602070 RepID=UPI002103BFC6|nr:L-fucose/L-arabinose isomerase family protein [Granulicella sp. WH15]